MRQTRAIIDLTQLDKNLETVRDLAPGAAVMAIVKANAYGHGAVEIARRLRRGGVEFLAVAFLSEAIELRESGDDGPIVVLAPHAADEAQKFIDYELQPVITTIKFLESLNSAALDSQVIVPVHILVDTGMNREGIPAANLLAALHKASELQGIEISSLCTHFATSPSNIIFAEKQLNIFNDSVAMARKAGIRFDYLHASNSGGILNLPGARFNIVRPGLLLYGYSPAHDLDPDIKPILTLRSEIVRTRKIIKGESVGYDRTFIADRPCNIATVPIGYGDGFSKSYEGKAECLIDGKRYPIVGTICMDMCMVDLGVDEYKNGSEVILIGISGSESIGAYDIADKSGTIPYEITTLLAKRVLRLYY